MTTVRDDGRGRPPLPEGWVWTKLGNIATAQSGAAFPKALQGRTEGDYPFAKVSDISEAVLNNEALLVKAANYVSAQEAQDLRAKVYPVGSTLFAKIGEAVGLNRRAIAVVPLLADNNVMGLLPETKVVLPKYVFYFMHTVDLYEYSRATTVPSVRKSDVVEIPFPLAPFPEQHRIVEAIETQFTRLDAAVRALERARANLARYKASVLKAACEGRLVPTEAELHSDDYEPADVLLERILDERRRRWEAEQWEKEVEKAKKKAAQVARKARGLPARISDLADKEWQDLPEEAYAKYLPKNDRWKNKYDEPEPPDTYALPELPEEWCWVILEQIAWDSRYGTSQKCSYESDGPPVMRIPNIVNGRIDFQDVKFGTKPGELIKVDPLAPDDLLIIRTNGSRDLIGRSALVRQFFEQSVYFASYLIRFRLVGLDSLPVWTSTIWDAPMMREWLESVAATSAGQYNISIRVLNQMSIPLPPLAEQRRIVEEVERCMSVAAEVEAAIEANLARAERLRQAILKRAFEGRLVPQDPNDEPTSVLLARIKAERKSAKPGQKKRRSRQLELL